MARLFVDNLTVIDFSYLDAERGVVGESWIVDLELAGDLNEQGMLFDFGDIKKQIKKFIDFEIDHRLLVPVASSGCRIDNQGDEMSIEFPLNAGGVISHQSPKHSVYLVDAEKIDIKKISHDLQTRIHALLPDNVSEVVIYLRNEIINGAYYHYTHGLQKHLGQCQRIAHGHRSRIEIKINGKRDPGLEAQWAGILKDSYMVTESHIVEELEVNGIEHTRMTYIAEQGVFSMCVPSATLFVMPMETTVENIAIYLAELIAGESKKKVSVKAYEGLNKGAYGEANC